MRTLRKHPWFKKMADKREAGFTLTEMLVVIALIAMLGTFVFTNVMGKFNRAKVDGTKIKIRQLMQLLDQYKLDCGSYPTAEQGLEALVTKPTGGKECKNYNPEGYITGGRVPKDEWDNDFEYRFEGRKPEIRSLGGDGVEGGADNDADISSNEPAPEASS
ncbi:MAG: type II secretion system major pseudopilin GspG [Bacteriovoracia bacterium]